MHPILLIEYRVAASRCRCLRTAHEREMLNESKHAGLLQVEVGMFVSEMMITCCCVCSVLQIWWDRIVSC